MNAEELKTKYPEIHKAIFDEGVTAGIAQGTVAERERIKDIDAIALVGMEELTNKAKFETGITAGAYALDVVKAQKQKGVTHLQNVQADAEEAGNVPAGGAPQNNDKQEEALLAHTAKRAKTLR